MIFVFTEMQLSVFSLISWFVLIWLLKCGLWHHLVVTGRYSNRDCFFFIYF